MTHCKSTTIIRANWQLAFCRRVGFPDNRIKTVSSCHYSRMKATIKKICISLLLGVSFVSLELCFLPLFHFTCKPYYSLYDSPFHGPHYMKHSTLNSNLHEASTKQVTHMRVPRFEAPHFHYHFTVVWIQLLKSGMDRQTGGSWQDCGAGLWNRRQAHGVLAVWKAVFL